MKLKNATIFGINPKFKLSASDQFDENAFAPISDLQIESSGWSIVRDGALYYTSQGQILLHFIQEKKVIPSSAIETVLAEKVAELEAAQGFAPGKKALKELKERVIDELLPRALPSRSRTAIWIDTINRRLIIDSSSNSTIDSALRLLCKTFETLGIEDVTWPADKVITNWLFEEPAGFTLDDEVALAYPGEKGKTVVFKAADVQDYDVTEHIQKHGASVETVAMTFDSRLSFVMTSNNQIRRIKMLDVVTSAAPAADVDRFESEFVLTTMEVSKLIDALIAEA